MENRIKLLAVCGPTASGKTALAIALAKALDGEIVSCDSMQIYRGMEIGTAKPTAEEMDGVPHHLLGFLDPAKTFSAADYTALAGKAIRDIASRGKRPLLVGGTGLYARALLRGTSFSEKGRDEAVRQALEAELAAGGIGPLYARLQSLDPEAAAQIHPNNTKRVIRALEYCQAAGEPFSAQAKTANAAAPPYDYVMLCLACAKSCTRASTPASTPCCRPAFWMRRSAISGNTASAAVLRCRPSATRSCSRILKGAARSTKRWKPSSGRRAGMPSGSSPGSGARKTRSGCTRTITRMRPR